MIGRTRSILDRELASLQEKLIQLGDMVDTAIDQSVQALTSRNVELAQEVITNDRNINVLRYEIERETLRVLATQQPTAIDLRMVLVATHLAIELERIGDHASGIARITERLDEHDEIESFHKIPKMANRVRTMLRDSIQSYATADTELANKIFQADEKVNKQNAKLFEKSLDTIENDTYIRRATYLIWVGHNLERMGDRVKNIAERVIFMVNGEFVEIVPPDLQEEQDIGG